MGQHAQGHEEELTPAIRAAAKDLLPRVNHFLELAKFDGQLASGWRPAAINAGIPGAAPKSLHMSGEAVDVRDSAGRALAIYTLDHLHQLAELGLYIEDPRATPTWMHYQLRAPASGRTVFIPSHDWAIRLAGQSLDQWKGNFS